MSLCLYARVAKYLIPTDLKSIGFVKSWRLRNREPGVSEMLGKGNFPNPNNYFLKLAMDLFAIDSIAQIKF
jgi:hypothetical protein